MGPGMGAEMWWGTALHAVHFLWVHFCGPEFSDSLGVSWGQKIMHKQILTCIMLKLFPNVSIRKFVFSKKQLSTTDSTLLFYLKFKPRHLFTLLDRKLATLGEVISKRHHKKKVLECWGLAKGIHSTCKILPHYTLKRCILLCVYLKFRVLLFKWKNKTSFEGSISGFVRQVCKTFQPP